MSLCSCPYCGADTTPNDVLWMENDCALVIPGDIIFFSPSQGAIMSALLKNHPHTVSAERLHMALTPHFQDHADPPSLKVVQVHIAHMRAKLREANAPIQILSAQYRIGYTIQHASDKEVIRFMKSA